MSNQDQDPNRPSRPPASFPPQPYQLIDENNNFTPYYVKPGEAKNFPGHVTPHLSNGLKHPAEYFAEPRNQFPGTDPIMDVRMGVCHPFASPLRVVYKLTGVREGR